MKKVISVFAAVLVMMLGLAIHTAQAQEDPGRLIKQLEDDSDRFSNSVTKALDKSRFDGTATEDQLIRNVREFEDSIDRLKKGWDHGEDVTLLATEVQTRSKAIDKFLKKNSLGRNVQTDWGTVKADLLRLKKTKMIKTV